MDIPHTKTAQEITDHLSHVVMCYAAGPNGHGYCHGDEDTDCNDGCKLLLAYKAGFEAGRQDAMADQWGNIAARVATE